MQGLQCSLTAREKPRLQRSLTRMQDLIRQIRLMRHFPVREQVISLNRVLRGYYAYYGVAGNIRGAAEGISGRGALLATLAGQPQSCGSDHMGSVQSNQAAVSVTATKAISSVPGVEGYCGAMNQVSKSVVWAIRTLRSVGAGDGQPPLATRGRRL